MNETELLIKFRDDFIFFAKHCLKIVDKRGHLIPFELNKQQIQLHKIIESQVKEKGKVRVIVLKSRRLGISTYVGARFIWKSLFERNKRTGIVTHVQASTNAIYQIYNRFYVNLPFEVKPETLKSNAKEIVFKGLDSSIKVSTAGSKDSSRGDTLHRLHASEVAFWPNAYENAASIVRSVAEADGTEIIMESTPFGINNYFHDIWNSSELGELDFEPVFLTWLDDPDCYTEPPKNVKFDDDELKYQSLYNLSNGQLYWRRQTIKGISFDKFQQEYPLTVAEAFRNSVEDSYIPLDLVLSARKRNIPEDFSLPLILGVDVAGMGMDHTVIAFRRGSVISKYIKLYKKTNDEIANEIIKIILSDKPTKIFIDGALHHKPYNEDLPLSSRISSIIDSYDAITSGRYGTPKPSIDDSIVRLTTFKGQNQKGIMYDPNIFDKFVMGGELENYYKNIAGKEGYSLADEFSKRINPNFETTYSDELLRKMTPEQIKILENLLQKSVKSSGKFANFYVNQ